MLPLDGLLAVLRQVSSYASKSLRPNLCHLPMLDARNARARVAANRRGRCPTPRWCSDSALLQSLCWKG